MTYIINKLTEDSVPRMEPEISTCNDCIHFNVCDLKRNHYFIGEPIEKVKNAKIACRHFYDKSNFVNG